MHEKIAREIHYAQLLCRYGRGVCVLLGVVFGLIALVSLLTLVSGHVGPDMPIALGNYVIGGGTPVPPAARAWGACVLLAAGAVLFFGLRFQFLLFGNLQRGEIFTDANVKLLRNLALVALSGDAVRAAVPMFTRLLQSWDVLDPQSVAVHVEHALSIQVLPGSFVTALLLWLASWIMDIGRRTQVEAERLRRDAELVV